MKFTGTICRFVGGQNEVVIGIERKGSGKSLYLLDPALLPALRRTYGIEKPGGLCDMEPIIGLRAEFEESQVGLIVSITPMSN